MEYKTIYKIILKVSLSIYLGSQCLKYARLYPNWSGIPILIFCIFVVSLVYKPLKKMGFFD